ncbi:MAG: hypothetical protein D6694_15470 [Gammaproteobacteria bacterium]|nr:MAG: hypothetical protein D6694_15470 [Gammaproteobacteria bacterium]
MFLQQLAAKPLCGLCIDPVGYVIYYMLGLDGPYRAIVVHPTAATIARHSKIFPRADPTMHPARIVRRMRPIVPDMKIK